MHVSGNAFTVHKKLRRHSSQSKQVDLLPVKLEYHHMLGVRQANKR